MKVQYVFVVCGECNAEVDRIEYDDTEPPAVVAVMDALNLSKDEAVKAVKRANPGAELSNAENAFALAETISKKAVKGRAKNTYRCPLGHNAALEVTEENPTPAVTTSITKVVGDK